MKRLVFLFLILVGVNGLVRAQQNKMPTPTEIAQKNVDELEKKVKTEWYAKKCDLQFYL